VATAFAEMERQARQMLERAGVPATRWELTRAADCRYPRQAYELTVPVASGDVTPATLERLVGDFHERHRMTYGHASPDEPVQCVNLRVSATGRLTPLDVSGAPAAPSGAAVPAGTTRDVYFKETGVVRCAVVARESLTAGASRPGPVIVASPDTTIVVPPSWRLSVEPGGSIGLERAHA
jgi:N-methylhydantoinase A